MAIQQQWRLTQMVGHPNSEMREVVDLESKKSFRQCDEAGDEWNQVKTKEDGPKT